jgi:hypothetical protein
MNDYAPDECPDRHQPLVALVGDSGAYRGDAPGVLAGNESLSADSSLGDAVLPSPEEKPKLPRSGTLGLADADELMRNRQVNLIGIVGFPNAGKTACLASLYLLLAHRLLHGFSFLGSKTLMAFEEISRGVRRWNAGNPPTQMTSHTNLADDRLAGFLHLRLKRESDGGRFDLLFPDLPGEWTRSLQAMGEAKRFEFLRAADVIWLMANGGEFLDEKLRAGALYRVTILIERLAAIFPASPPRIIFVATWHDLGAFPEDAYSKMEECGKKHGFNIEFFPIASFSDGDTKPGYGLSELIESSVATSVKRVPFWPNLQSERPKRSFLSFGRDV